jgi:hypothetical protein
MFRSGDVVTLPGPPQPFGDCTILGFRQDDDGAYWASVARPYCFASGVGTTSPAPLMGCEIFEVSLRSLMHWGRAGRVTVLP